MEEAQVRVYITQEQQHIKKEKRKERKALLWV
jgi:hypothetical protein